MYADNVPVPTSKDQWDYVQLMSNNLRSTFNALSTVFSPACIAHEVFLGRDWTSIQVDGVTLPDALECWASSLPNGVSDPLSTNAEEVIFSSSTSSNHELLIRSQLKSDSVFLSNGNVGEFSSINSKSQNMLADAPRSMYDVKLNSNHVRRILTPSEIAEENSRNSISNRASLPNRQRNHGKILNNRTDRRRGSNRGSRDEKRKKRKRLQRRLEKCRNGDDDACEKLRKHHGKDMFEDDPLKGGAGKGKLKQNSNLVRSLDRRSSRKGSSNDKTSTDRKKRKTVRQRNLEKRRAKRLRKQKRRQQRRERKRRQREQLKKRRELRRLRKRNKQNKEKEVIGTKSSSQEAIGTVSASSKGDEKHHLKVRSVQEPSILLTPIKSIPKKSSHSQCRVKLIDDCSWPHCNRSCPKLKNPKTGKYQQTSTNSLIRRFLT